MNVPFAIWSEAGGGPAPLYASVDPVYDYTVVYWDGIINPRTVVSSSFLCTPHNGTPPYTYLWEAVSNPDSINITASAASSTTFNKSLSTSSGMVTGTFRCKVTDAAAAVVYTPTITVELEHATSA